jgi:hypothetical protein
LAVIGIGGVIKVKELIPKVSGKVGKEAIQDSVQVDLEPLIRKIIMCEQLVVEGVPDSGGKGSNESTSDERRELYLDRALVARSQRC